jgi:hypothetical protein
VRHEVRVEAGVASIEQVGTTVRNAFILSGIRHHGDTVLAALLSGAVTWARDSVAAFQGIGALAWRPSPLSAWQVEGGASGAAFALTPGSHDANGSTWVRTRRQLSPHVGAVVGGALGHTIRTGSSNHSTGVEIGGWAGTGALHLDFGYTRMRTEDSLLLAASRVFTRQRSAWLDVDDIMLAATWEHGPFELTATGKRRSGARGTDADQSAVYATASYAFTERYSVAASAGRLLADPLRGSPDATIVMALVRLSFAEVTTPPTPGRESEATVARLADGSVVVLRIHAAATARVEVAGSFSGWEGVPVAYKGDVWESQIRVPPGRHRLAYRVDGGAWKAPANLGKLKEFGGEVGLIVVP